jgi:hypothetical protein
MLTTKKTNRTLNEESGQETETQTHGVSRSLTRIGIALWRHWVRTLYDSSCIKHLDIHSALYPTDESFSLKGHSGRNGKLMTHSWSWVYECAVHFQYSDRRPRCGVYARISSCMNTPRIETGALTIYTRKFITMETEIVRGRFQEYQLSSQWKRMGHIPDKGRVLCQIFALS